MPNLGKAKCRRETKRADAAQSTVPNHSCPILCCIFSFTVWYALMIVCSLITISVVSGRGRLTRDAIAAGSVSTMILQITISSLVQISLHFMVKSYIMATSKRKSTRTHHQWSHPSRAGPGRDSREPLASPMHSVVASLTRP